MKKLISILLFYSYSIIVGSSNNTNITIIPKEPDNTKIETSPIIRNYTETEILNAIIIQESGGSVNLNDTTNWENAVGILQIRPIMVKHINENILKYDAFTLEDRLDSLKSIKMFLIYQQEYNPDMDFEVAARIWNGGQRGMNKVSTIKYFKAVEQIIQK